MVPHIRRKEYDGWTGFSPYLNKQWEDSGATADLIVGHFHPVGAGIDPVPGSEEEMFAGSTRFVNISMFGRRHVFCGHIHKPQEFKKVHIPGSIVRFDMGEREDEKRFLIYNSEDKSVESIPLHCQEMVRITLDLTSADVLEISPDDLKEHKGKLVDVELVVNDASRSLVSTRYIREVFQKAGIQLWGVHTKDIQEKQEIDKRRSKMNPVSVFKRITTQVIKDKEKRKRVGKRGLKVLEEAKDDS